MYVVPANRPNAPTIYLLDGLRAPANDTGWLINTNVANFMRGRGVNLVMPFGGAGSFYTDWQQRDPKLGLNRWETFLTRELPRYMKSKYQSDGVRNGIGGLSMSGTSALNIASRHASMYKSVASYSGYPTVTMPGFNQGIQMSVAEVGGNPVNMWGMFPGRRLVRQRPVPFGWQPGWQVGVRLLGYRHHKRYDSAINPGSPNFDPMRFVQMVPLGDCRVDQQPAVHRPAADRGRASDHPHFARRRSLVGLLAAPLQGVLVHHLQAVPSSVAGGNNNLGSGSLGSLGSTGSGSWPTPGEHPRGHRFHRWPRVVPARLLPFAGRGPEGRRS